MHTGTPSANGLYTKYFKNWLVSINSSDYYMLAPARERRGVHLEQLFSESSRNNDMQEYCFFDKKK